MIVADTNLISYLHIPGDRTPDAEAVLRKDAVWVAPRLWRSEFCNVLALYIRKGHLTLARAQAYVEMAESLLGDHVHEVIPASVLELTAHSGCSAYDAEFVHLAQALQVPLVTNDGALLRLFPGVAVSPEGFTS